MRVSKAAYGIIKHGFGNEDLYLLQINPAWNNQFNFISGHIEPEDENDFHKTMIRETEEELPPLKHKEHFLVRLISDDLFQAVAYSQSARVQTEYTFSVFLINFLVSQKKISFLWENEVSPNRWFTEDELRRGRGKRGERITRFPVPQIIDFIPGRLENLPDSFSISSYSPKTQREETCNLPIKP